MPIDESEIDGTMRELMDLSPDAIFFKDGQGRWLWVNQAGLALFGLSAVAYRMKTDAELVEMLGTESPFYRNIFTSCQNTDEKAWEAGTPWRGEEKVEITGQAPRYYDVIKTPLLGPRGQRRGLLGIRRDITDQKEAHSKIHYLSNYDPLTGLPNRGFFQSRLQHAVGEAQENRNLLAVLLLDLDHFKKINETLGHATGDLLLKAVSERLLPRMQPGDIMARLSGDEFAIVQTRLQNVEDTARLAQGLIRALAKPFLLAGHEIHSGASIGITIYPFNGLEAEQLLKNADMAMYQAKQEGRNNFQFYSADLNIQTRRRISLEKELRRALENGELRLHYQAQAHIQDEGLIGMEALVRWEHPSQGLVPPAEFIPVAEESGLIVPIGEWVLHAACAQNKAWQDQGLPPLQMAVNISALQLGFRHRAFVQSVAKALQHSGLAPTYLELELTESVVMSQPERAAVVLQELKEMGVHFAIDDFGTGYSSLSYLKRFPIDKLKIDRSFVRDIAEDPSDAAIVKAVIHLGHSLNLEVVAEGVEEEKQLKFLRAQQCSAIQGYYISRPLPAPDFAAFFRHRFQAVI